MSIYNSSGALRVSVSDGIGFKGYMSPAGSLWVTEAPGGTFVGNYAPDGSLYVTVTTSSGFVGRTALDGSMYVSLTGPVTNGSVLVEVVSGALGLNSVMGLVSTVRAGDTATYTDSGGVLQTALANTLRYDFSNPNSAGWLIEQSAINVLLNSLIDGTALTTQSVTVSAVAYTLSFYGTGTVTLSGVSTAGPLVGSGAYPTRSSLTFTPTEGSLTLTVSGDVKFAQLQTGSFATSFIATAGAAVTRATDDVSLLLSNLPQWNPLEGTFVVDFVAGPSVAAKHILDISNGATSKRIYLATGGGGTVSLVVYDGGVQQAVVTSAAALVPFSRNKVAISFRANAFHLALNGVAATPDTVGTMPTVDRIQFGANLSKTASTFLNGHLVDVDYASIAYPSQTLIDITAP